MREDGGVTTTKGPRGRYHHGDLGNALTDAATDLARRGGPEAVVLREAARQVGVSATAAYRHFANHDDLIHAVKERSQGDLAAAMNHELGALPPEPDPGQAALDRMRAIGRGYLHFAQREPGLFRTAFCRAEGPAEQAREGMAESAAYRILTDALDDLVTAGVLAPHRRPHAEAACWAAVHGLAMLLLDGPLHALPQADRDAAVERTLDLVADGLTAGRAG
jgi:AcrR family transcriptional regulator